MAPTLIREGRTPRGKCCGFSSGIRSRNAEFTSRLGRSSARKVNSKNSEQRIIAAANKIGAAGSPATSRTSPAMTGTTAMPAYKQVKKAPIPTARLSGRRTAAGNVMMGPAGRPEAKAIKTKSAAGALTNGKAMAAKAVTRRLAAMTKVGRWGFLSDQPTDENHRHKHPAKQTYDPTALRC